MDSWKMVEEEEEEEAESYSKVEKFLPFSSRRLLRNLYTVRVLSSSMKISPPFPGLINATPRAN